MWRQLAEIAEKYVRKGSLLYIEGKIQSRTYDDKEGIKRYALEVVADTMKLIGPKPEGTQIVLNENQKGGSPSPIETTDLEQGKDDLPF